MMLLKLLAVGVSTFVLAAATSPPSSNAPLTTVAQVHHLSADEAKRNLPLHLTGVVTAVMPEWNGFALQDKTDGVYVGSTIQDVANLRTGDHVTIDGHTAPGNFAPIAIETRLRKLGTAKLPSPAPARWQTLASGQCDNNFVAIDGVVQSANFVHRPAARWNALELRINLGGNLVSTYLRNAGALPVPQLVDSEVEVDGVCIVLANSRRQFEGNVILIPSAASVRISKLGAADPFEAPLQRIDHLFSYSPGSPWFHRVKVEGTVTLREGERLFLEQGNQALLVYSTSQTPVQIGDRVEAAGFPAPGSYSTVLADAVFRVESHGSPPEARPVRAAEVLTATHGATISSFDGLLVRIDGNLLDDSRSANEETLTLDDHGTILTARLPGRHHGAPLPEAGSRVAVTGICMVQTDDHGGSLSFELLLRHRRDVRLLAKPPWLTLAMARRAAEALLVVALLAGFWLVLLGRRVQKQTSVIRSQYEKQAAIEQRFRRLVDQASDMVFTCDFEGKLEHVNRGTEHLTGYSRAELLRMAVADLLVPEEREWIRQLVSPAGAQHSAPLSSEWQFLRKDGREITVEVNRRLIEGPDGEGGLECIGRDITARKQAFSDNQERFRTLADNIAQLAWMADPSGFVFWFNQRWFEYTGTTLDQVRGWDWESLHHPDHVERVITRMKESFEKGELWEDTFPLRGANGQYRWFLGRAMPIRDHTGKVVRWFGTDTDITEQKEAEAALYRSNSELQQFAYVASHDLQEPLRNICAFTELLARSLSDTERTEQRQKYVGIITNGALRMQSLITDLLSYSRASLCENQERAAVNLEAVLDQVMNNLTASIEESGATLTHDPLPELTADASQITQLFQNLIGNAIKYRREGVAPAIHISARRLKQDWQFSVCDNGQGFEPVYADKIFGIFKRLHTVAIPGTGIGLAICKTIVERHGGKIWARSEPGRGAEFFFTLPATA